jgi:hypothetical protein
MWGGILLLVAFTVIASPAFGDEVADLKAMVQDLQNQVADLQKERAHDSSAVDRAVEEYLTRRAAGETSGDTSGYVDGKFTLASPEGDFKLNIGGGATANLQVNEPGGMQDNTFALALVRLALSGQIGDGWFFRVQPEFSTSGVELKDAWIRASMAALVGASGSQYLDGVQLKAGQFKMPFSMAALCSPYTWDTIRTPMVVRALAPTWDVGAQLSNTLYDGMLMYALAISNGTNAINDTDEFWYWARLVVAPFLTSDSAMVRNMHFGASFGTTHTARGGTSTSLSTFAGGPYGEVCEPDSSAMYGAFNANYPLHGRQILWGLELLWYFGQWAVKAEGLWAIQDTDPAMEQEEADPPDYYPSMMSMGPSIGVEDGVMYGDEVETVGFYVQVLYALTGGDWAEDPDDGLEVVGQVEWVEVDAGGDTETADAWAYTLGLNYYFTKNACVRLAWTATDLGDDTLRSMEEDGIVRGGGLEHVLALRLQLTF